MDSVARTFVDALLKLDFEALQATLHPQVEFRALVPGELVNVNSSAEAVKSLRRWFADKSDLELLQQRSETLVDRLMLEYRLRLKKAGQSYLVEQRIWSNVDNGRFSVIDLVCSGFRPEGVVETDATVHRFDAGDLGCGSGLPREFRARINQIPVGHVLEVLTKDPSAKEDLPSISRMMGHKVLSIEPGAEGKVIIRVERGK